MGLLQRRTKLGQAVKAIGDVKVPPQVGAALSRARPPKAVTSGVSALAALTAASAGVSAMRRRSDGEGDR
jgi:hypothetical protein